MYKGLQYDKLLSNCVSYCKESGRNEYKYHTILYSLLLYSLLLYSWLLYSTMRALILLLL